MKDQFTPNIEAQSWPLPSVPDSILETTKKLQDHMVLCVSVNYHFATGGAEEYSSYEIWCQKRFILFHSIKKYDCITWEIMF